MLDLRGLDATLRRGDEDDEYSVDLGTARALRAPICCWLLYMDFCAHTPSTSSGLSGSGWL